MESTAAARSMSSASAAMTTASALREREYRNKKNYEDQPKEFHLETTSLLEAYC